MAKNFTRLSLLAWALFQIGCASDSRVVDRDTQYLAPFRPAGGRPVPLRPVDTVSYWDGDGVGGSPAIRISLGEQRAYFYKGGHLVGVSIISSGREGFNTGSGTFRIIQKDQDHKSSLYGDYVDASGNVIKKDIDIKKDLRPPGARFDGARMPFFMRIVGGTGMHAGYLPGYPASHGCIRMPESMAEQFFANAPMGTPVTVTH